MREIALSSVIGALSHALDITEGPPAGHAVRSCMIGMRIAEELELPARVRSDLFYALLLKDAGCSANAERMAALFGADDRHLKRTSKRVDWSRSLRAMLWSLRTVEPGGSLRERAARLRGMREEGDVTRKVMQARCDRGADIARMLYLSDETAAAIRSLDEHRDGRGMPDGLAGEEIPLLARIRCPAQTAEIFPTPTAGSTRPARSRGGAADAGSTPRSSRRSRPSATTAPSGARSRRPTCRAGSRRSSCCAPTTSGSTASPRRSRA